MKKIYSFMLLAAVMLLSISVKAEVRTVGTVEDGGTYQSLLAAFNDANDGDEIKLVSNITSNDPIHINHGSITLNLNGHNVLTDAILRPFYLYKGTLRVTGTGEIRNSYDAKNVQIFYVYGSFFPIANYTHLIIEENVSLVVPNGPKGRGIQIATSISSEGAIQNINNETIPYNGIMGSSWGFAHGVVIDVYGDITVTTTEGYCIQISGRVRHAGDYAGQTKTYNGTTQTIQADWADYAPVINLYSTCHLIANSSSTGAAAIYAAGYATWNLIGCEAEGSCALAIKSGNITVTDATLKSTATEYKQPTDKTAGIDTQGSAVLIESNNTYSGTISVTFEGDTHIEAKAGYAIQEAIPNVNSNSDSHVSSFNIEGGSFVGGTETGCFIVSEGTLGNPTSSITIGGGSYTAQTEEQQTATQTLLETLLGNQTPSNPNYTIEVNNGGASQTGTSIIINQTVIPDPITTVFTFSDLKDAASAGQDVNLAEAQVDGGQLVIAEDIELQNLYMNSENGLSIIIPNGITMTAKRIVMGDNDNITVKAGGRLIIDGDQGLYNVKNENLLIEAEEGNMGLFIWKPTVASNRHPHATVQFISKAYGPTLAQRFGVPAYRGMKIGEIQKQYPTNWKYWDNSINGWGNFTSLENILEPFTGYGLITPSATSGNNLYSMPCNQLYGNVNAEMNFAADHGWNYFSNSYTGEINIKEMLLQWRDLGKCEQAVQFNLSSTSNDWEGISLLDIEDLDNNIPGIYLPISKIAPMQCFITRTKENEEAFKDILDYEALVWNHKDEANEPIGTPQAAPARRNMAQVSDYTKAIVVIANGENEQRVTLRQGSQFSEEFDNGAEMSCFKNGNINLFATTEYGDMAQVATDNLMGKTLSVESAKAASFKMTFTGLYGEQLAIRDNITGSVINMTEDEEYFFSVAPGTTADRFEIVEAAKMPTDVEMLEAAPAKKGIYTLVGQYLGENFDVLPAGIYVVNGKKVVK